MDNDFLNSRMGRHLVSRIELNLDVVVPGLWMDLGPAHLFTTDRRISSFGDITGLRVWMAGGIANKMREESFGAEGVIIPWPDLSPRIANGSVEGVLTSFESLHRAALWNYGIRYAFLDYEYFLQYIPLVSRYVWDRLTGELQHLFISDWNSAAEKQRGAASAAQRDAMEAAVRNGVQIESPAEAEMEKAKERLMSRRNDFIRPWV